MSHQGNYCKLKKCKVESEQSQAQNRDELNRQSENDHEKKSSNIHLFLNTTVSHRESPFTQGFRARS
jgi:hypothetical protein